MSLLHNTSKKSAAVLSYISLLIGTLSTFFLTPFLLHRLGVDEYGLYQMVYSVAHYILILDLGIATVMVRYISEYRARGDQQGEQNFASMILMICALLSLCIVGAGLIINANLENIFTKLTTSDYEKSHQMFMLMIAQFAVTVFLHYFTGIIKAYERFSLAIVINIAKVVISIALTVLLVSIGTGAVGIVVANTIGIVLEIIVCAIIASRVLHFKARFYHWDKILFKSALGLMLAMLLQSVVGHVNSAADKTILGIMMTKRDVAVYSIAATIVTFFNTIPTTIAGLFQPQAIKIIVHSNDKERLTDLVIRVGRWQFTLAGAVMFLFLLAGQDFISIWAGKNVSQSWLVAMIIIPFNLIPLVQTVCISILNGYDKRLDRSLILAGMTIVNIVLTVFLINRIGYLGAPIGTAVSYLLGHGIIMNIYYKRVIKLNVRRMFSSIFSGILPCLLVATLATAPLLLWNTGKGMIDFVLKVVLFCIVGFLCLYQKGWNQEERSLVNSALRKIGIKVKEQNQ